MELKLILRLLLVVMIFPKSVGAQTSFYECFSGNGYDKGEGIVQLADSSYLITGSSSSFEDAPSQAFLLHIDKTGNYLWSKAYGGSEFENGRRVLAIDGYGYFIAGASSSGASANFDAWLTFVNESGEQQWEQHIDLGAHEWVNDAVLLADSSVLIIGETDSTASGENDILLARISKAGQVVWSKKIGSTGPDRGLAMKKLDTMHVVIAGSWYNEDSLKQKGYVAKMDIDGNLIWNKQLGLACAAQINELIITTEIMALGESVFTGYTDADLFRSSLDFNGNIVWNEEGHSDHSARYVGGVQYTAMSNGKFFVATQAINPGFPTFPEGEDNIVYRFASYFGWDGYGLGYNGTGQDQINHMIPTKDGYAVFVGFHTTIGGGGNSVFVVKIGNENVFPSNSLPPINPLVDIIENGAFAQVKIYPNPFSESLTLELGEKIVQIRVLAINGEEHAQFNASGKYQIDLSQLAAGTYFLQLTSEKGTGVAKVVKN
ncbi:MAG: T9SS type A sorting domain-containing protein [Fluviicola sp.]|jgi:hypothetical protein